jgi:hypothetical protein
MEPDEGVELIAQVGGKTHKGRYTADRHGVITVWHPEYGEKITQRGGANTLATARALMKELVRQAENAAQG